MGNQWVGEKNFKVHWKKKDGTFYNPSLYFLTRQGKIVKIKFFVLRIKRIQHFHHRYVISTFSSYRYLKWQSFLSMGYYQFNKISSWNLINWKKPLTQSLSVKCQRCLWPPYLTHQKLFKNDPQQQKQEVNMKKSGIIWTCWSVHVNIHEWS